MSHIHSPSSMNRSSRPVRIGGASGAASDRRTGIAQLAANYKNDPVDVIIGDWMSEANMTTLAARKVEQTKGTDKKQHFEAYEATFLDALAPALEDIAKYGIKIVVNAGASDTQRLHAVVVDLVKARNLSLNVAWISGDEVLDTILKLRSSGSDFRNVYTNESLAHWSFEPIYAQAYLGGLGIAAAFDKGADIVLCGRVSDASLVIGAAAWWHGWNQTQLPQLANALVAGHLIECSTYITGGNFSGFKVLEKGQRWLNLGYPIAEIARDGATIITKQKHTGGMVTIDTCKSQLLYEIQGPWYFNSDVTAVLDNVSFKQIGPDRVSLSGVGWAPPPSTTKVGITARGGFQAEIHYYLVGLDTDVKARMFEQQVRSNLHVQSQNFSLFEFQKLGTPAPNASDQNSATVDFRVIVQARKEEHIAPSKFVRPIVDLIMSSYPGGTFNLDARQGIPKPVFEYYVTLMDQSDVKHRAHLHTGEIVDIPPPADTKVFPRQQPTTSSTAKPTRLSRFGKTVKAPIGLVAHARSGDKGSDANVGFWVQEEDEYEWLRSLLSCETMKVLLGTEYNGQNIDRFELANIWGVHFLLRNHLDRGVSCTSTVDFLGKNVAEFLRARHVDVPIKFLKRRGIISKL